MEELERWLELVEKNGGRLTTPRRAIVSLLVSANCAMDPLEIYGKIRQQNPHIGLVTIYRTLDLLARLGLVERIHRPDGCHLVLRAAIGHEHVVLCTSCGRAEFFSGEDISTWIENISRESGFQIQSHWLQLQGLCVDCQQKQGTN
jgi:Fur family transcriptional regulator, ferric uptake regulator